MLPMSLWPRLRPRCSTDYMTCCCRRLTWLANAARPGGDYQTCCCCFARPATGPAARPPGLLCCCLARPAPAARPGGDGRTDHQTCCCCQCLAGQAQAARPLLPRSAGPCGPAGR
jgi:hypothetical protein